MRFGFRLVNDCLLCVASLVVICCLTCFVFCIGWVCCTCMLVLGFIVIVGCLRCEILMLMCAYGLFNSLYLFLLI